MEDMEQAQCPYCYEGQVVQDNTNSKQFFCSRCLRNVDIKLHKDHAYNHL